MAELDPAEREFHKNKDSYHDFVEHSSDLLCIHDLQGRILSANASAARLLGYSVAELLQIPLGQLIAPEFQPQFNLYLGQLARARKSRGFLTLVSRSGERLICKFHSSLRREGISALVVQAIARDVTAQKRAEKSLLAANRALLAHVQESERTLGTLTLFRTLVDQSNDAIEVVDPETLRFLDVNQKACSELGYTREEMLSMGVLDIDPAATLPFTLEVVKELRMSGSKVMESVHRRKDGSTFPVEISMRRVQLERDYVIAIVHNLTVRKNAFEALLQTEERFRQMADNIQEIFWMLDAENLRVVYVNPAYEQISGRTCASLYQSSLSNREHIHAADRVRVLQRLDDLVKTGRFDEEFRIIRPDGSMRWLWSRGFPILDAQGNTYRLVGVAQDITERKLAEESLRRSEQDYRMFISQSSEGIFREEMDAPVSIDLPEDELARRILYDSYMAECNDALARMYGLTSGQEFVGKRLTEMLPPEDPRNIELTRQYIRSGFRILDRESHEVDIHGNPRIFLNSMIGVVENGQLVRTWGMQRDITEKVKLEEERNRAEDALRKNLAHLREVTEQLRLAKEKLSEEKLYLQQAIDTELGFGEIVGRSHAIKAVMEKVFRVAPSNATVLLLGETGTGKELVARALHRLSTRQNNSFIKLNCAAIPSGLLESELFGHEKGAFTGAVAKKVGRLELADRGTLFLDEVGEIPLDLQPKLLRVLQDQEFERLGGTQTLKVDFRLLAATNRNLLQSMKQNEFRSDLYYRLNVFPILTPPLRERREDINSLVEHFVHKYAARMNKSITGIPARTMEALVRWDWPGNIRELENFVERSVILTPGSVLQAPLGELQAAAESVPLAPRDQERERILRILRDCHGQLGGPNGAAARLGLKRTTLQSKLSHLGIKPGSYRS